MEDWNEEFLAVEVEREIEKHRAERESLTTGATGKKSGCGILIGLFIGLTVLVMVCLLLIK
jgi:tetrahydromethanopterin S-methyltransferase subunit G